MKNILIAGNWKMNTTADTAVKLCNDILNKLDVLQNELKVLVCPPFINIPIVSDIVKDTQLLLGAQNCYFEEKGAFTGEVSIPMLLHFGCQYVIIGHSERRTHFYETDALINKKVNAVLKAGLKPILCIGETLQERQDNKTYSVIDKQLKVDLTETNPFECENIVIAYEPVWAIGTGITATTEQISEAHAFIRNKLIEIFGSRADNMLIQYGGSVTADNSKEILGLKDVNGALIGGASLKSDSFLSIIEDAKFVLR
jgi:triosephosphate isomerase